MSGESHLTHLFVPLQSTRQFVILLELLFDNLYSFIHLYTCKVYKMYEIEDTLVFIKNNLEISNNFGDFMMNCLIDIILSLIKT